ncbi:MAG: serine hydrolase, partial [Sediminibacterium sp.]|nr:serine hydrolase [Sediminibacterium sp.]
QSLFNPDSTLILFLSDPKYLHYVDSFPNVVFVNNFQYANLADLCKLLNSEIPAASNIYFFNNHQWQVINAIDMYPNIEIKNQNAVKDTDTNYNFKNLDTLLIKGFRFKSFNDAHYIVFKDNTIIYDSYISNKGLQKNIPVQNAPIFDYENLTNIAVTTLGLIKLISDNKNKYDIYNCLELFFPDYKNFPISKIPLSNILLHRSGLGDEIEFLHYLKNKNNPDELNPNYFSYYIKPEYTQPFADNIFVRDTLKSLLFTTIISSEISNQKKFVFSQLGFYLLGKVVETMSNKPLDIFFKENYLKPLSLNYTNYLPRQYFTKSIIVPSYNDTVYRKQLIQGYSTDQLTSLNGGISGNGGLFGTAKELGYLFVEFQNELLGQQNLNLNYYNNQVLNEFINLLPLPFNKRGLGFELSYKINNVDYPSKYISDKAFGSRTDNGSFIWLDPKNHLVFVFFTNRNCCPQSKLNYNAFHSLLIDNIYQGLHLNGN